MRNPDLCINCDHWNENAARYCSKCGLLLFNRTLTSPYPRLDGEDVTKVLIELRLTETERLSRLNGVEYYSDELFAFCLIELLDRFGQSHRLCLEGLPWQPKAADARKLTGAYKAFWPRIVEYPPQKEVDRTPKVYSKEELFALFELNVLSPWAAQVYDLLRRRAFELAYINTLEGY